MKSGKRKAESGNPMQSGTERSEIANRRLPQGTRRGARATRKTESGNQSGATRKPSLKDGLCREMKAALKGYFERKGMPCSRRHGLTIRKKTA